MLKINYPTNNLNKLHADYISLFRINAIIENRYSNFRNKFNIHVNLPARLSDLLVAPFHELVGYSTNLNPLQSHLRWLKKIFNYNDFQKPIAKFFMANSQSITLATCYYCNIDHVNVFDDMGDFHSWLDFIRRGNVDDFQKIRGIEQAGAQALFNSKNKINNLQDLSNLGFRKKVIYNLENLLVKKKHNHFTIDHVLDKANHPLLSLCLYNFVPSCYACNSKFKKKTFITTDAEAFLSPTCSAFNFDNDVKFKIFFHMNRRDILDITKTQDFVLDLNCTCREADYLAYINTFKLRGRYVFYKQEIVDLVQKKKEYDDSQILKLSTFTGKSVDSIKSVIFGSQLFEGDLADKPLTKLRRDIAREILITGVR